MILIFMLNKLSRSDRVDKVQETEAFLTIKDHHEIFPHTVSFRLINPSKSDTKKISKSLLNTINKNILKQANGKKQRK